MLQEPLVKRNLIQVNTCRKHTLPLKQSRDGAQQSFFRNRVAW